MTRLRAAIALCAMVVLFAVLGPYSPGEERVTKPGPIAAADAIQDAIPDAVAEPASDPLLPVDAIADLTLEQRVGQLFMVGTPVARASAETLDAVASRFAGGVFLHGRSSKGVEATAREAARLRAVAQSESLGIPLWIATDQEGGEVQVLSGQGFDGIPYARDQAERDAATLRDDAGRWGEQLRAAGVTMNLAPVADIVTSRKAARKNAPIGALWREYGYDEAAVAAKAGAFAAGMRDAGVMPTFKHFPGLGRVTGNTDYSADVVDTVVAAGSPDVEVYRTLTAQGRSVVMVGAAVYEKIDAKRPAVFSPAVVTGILRGELGFEGVVTTDDLSATAQVEKWTPAERAVSAIAAGVDLVLVSADPSVFPEMYDAVLAEATSDAAFAEKVDDAARRIVDAKGRKAPGGRP